MGADGAAGADLLAAVVHHSGLHQLHDAGAQHLCLDPQVPLPGVDQILSDRVGQPPQAQLQTGPVRYHVGDVSGDAPVRLIAGDGGSLHQRAGGLDDAVHLRDVEFGVEGPVAFDIGHVGMDLRQHQLALLQKPPVQAGAPDGPAHPAVLIRRRAGEHRRPGMPGEEPVRRLAQMGGHIVDVAHGGQGPLHAEKVGVIGHMVRALRRQQPGARGNEVGVHLNVTPLCPQALSQGGVQLPGPVGHGGKGQHVPVPDQGGGLRPGHLKGPILLPPGAAAGAAAPAAGLQLFHDTSFPPGVPAV